MDLIGAFLTGVVGPLLYLLINKYVEKKKDKKRCQVKENITNTHLVNEELMVIRDEFESDRVWISQFHNGGNFYPTGKSIQKFSIFYEVTKVGISTGPFAAGPIMAAPKVIGPCVICDWSFSLAKTPGDNKVSAIL